MKCRRCNNTVTEEIYCKKCFTYIIEKRVRKHIRTNIGFRKGQTILVLDQLSKYFIEKFNQIVKIKYVPKKQFDLQYFDEYIYKNKGLLEYLKHNQLDYVAVPLTADSQITNYLTKIFEGNKPKRYDNKRIIRLFDTITSDEIQLFCRYKKFNLPEKKTSVSKFVEKLESRFKGSKHSINKAIKQ